MKRMKQLELNFKESGFKTKKEWKEDIDKRLKKQFANEPWLLNGFQTKEEWDKAKAFDRAFRHYEQSNKGVKNV